MKERKKERKKESNARRSTNQVNDLQADQKHPPKREMKEQIVVRDNTENGNDKTEPFEPTVLQSTPCNCCMHTPLSRDLAHHVL